MLYLLAGFRLVSWKEHHRKGLYTQRRFSLHKAPRNKEREADFKTIFHRKEIIVMQITMMHARSLCK